MEGIMLFFIKNYAAGTRNSEQFMNPRVQDLSVTIHGVPHKLFSDGMKSTDLWNALKQKVGCDKILHGNFKEQDFHNDKFAVWVDLTASPENWLHGDGLVVGRSKARVDLDWEWCEWQCRWNLLCLRGCGRSAVRKGGEGQTVLSATRPLRLTGLGLLPAGSVGIDMWREKKRDGKNTNSFFTPWLLGQPTAERPSL